MAIIKTESTDSDTSDQSSTDKVEESKEIIRYFASAQNELEE